MTKSGEAPLSISIIVVRRTPYEDMFIEVAQNALDLNSIAFVASLPHFGAGLDCSGGRHKLIRGKRGFIVPVSYRHMNKKRYIACGEFAYVA
jgi:hypothetical protein